MNVRIKAPIIFTPIGVIRSPFPRVGGVPIQAAAAMDVPGSVEVWDLYSRGLKDLEGFSHIIVLYHFHLSGEMRLHLRPFLDDTERGVFATRAPTRPNPISISVVRLVSRKNNILTIRGVDMVDRTPLPDIKPYVPGFDVHPGEQIGRLAGRQEKTDGARADDRFT